MCRGFVLSFWVGGLLVFGCVGLVCGCFSLLCRCFVVLCG